MIGDGLILATSCSENNFAKQDAVSASYFTRWSLISRPLGLSRRNSACGETDHNETTAPGQCTDSRVRKSHQRACDVGAASIIHGTDCSRFHGTPPSAIVHAVAEFT